jgi:hypothetical protein
MPPPSAGNLVMYEVTCCFCKASCWMIGSYDVETNGLDLEPDGTEEWEGGCVVIDGLFVFNFPCDHEDFEATGEQSHPSFPDDVI